MNSFTEEAKTHINPAFFKSGNKLIPIKGKSKCDTCNKIFDSKEKESHLCSLEITDNQFTAQSWKEGSDFFNSLK